MTMVDWASKLEAFLQFNDAEILQDKGKITAAIAKAFAESEFEKYRILQDESEIIPCAACVMWAAFLR